MVIKVKDASLGSIECRGRNGWFQLNEVNILNGKNGSFVDFFSSRRGDSPPVILMGDGKDLITLFSGILKELKR